MSFLDDFDFLSDDDFNIDDEMDDEQMDLDTYGNDISDENYAEDLYYDNNGDGFIDTIISDTDNDGIHDTAFGDINGDGKIDTIMNDFDQDNEIDQIKVDINGDGAFETDVSDNIFYNPEYLADNISNDSDIFSESIHMGTDDYFDPIEGTWYPPRFDSESGGEGVIGDPADDMEHWHPQTHPDTCAIVSQEFILEELTGHEFDENELMQIADENGWYSGGTAPNDVGNLLEHFGLNVEKHYDSSIEEIETALENGEKVIVGLDSDEIWIPGQSQLDSALNEIQGIPDNDANHAVQVIGIDRSDPNNPMVILNDPGHPGGHGSMIPLDDFEGAWEDCDNFVVRAAESDIDIQYADLDNDGSVDSIAFSDSFSNISNEVNDLPLENVTNHLGGYYNEDGTYHWTIDGSNTDEDGNILYYS